LNSIEVPAVSGEQSVEIIHWALTHTVDHEVGRRLAKPLSHFLLKAWQCRSEATLEAFAHFFLQIIKDDRWHTIQSIAKGFLSEVSTSHADRIRLVEKIIQLGDTDSWSWLAAALPVPLVTADDLPWLLNHIAHPDGEFPEAASVQLILAVLSQKDLNDLHDVWVASDSSQRLLSGLENYFSCELESQQSDWLRTELKRRQDREQQKQRQWDEIKRAVESKLTQVFTTSSFAWWELNLGLLADENGQLEEFRSDLTSSTIWAALEANVQVRIVEGATAYLVENRIPSLRWLGTATFNRPAAAAFRAFRLLLDRGLLDRNTFSESVWRKWAACVFTPFNTGSSDSAPLTKIVHLAYEAAPNEMLRAIARFGVKARGRYDLHRAINILDSCFDERIGAVYWSLLKRRYDDERAEELASYLARKAHPKTIQLLVKELKATDAARTIADAVLIAGVSSALINCTREIWSDFYDFSSRNESVALDIVRALARSGRVNDEGFVDRMEEQELAKFYIWTHQKIPPPSEAFRDGPRWVSDDDQVDNVRSAALKRLTDSGSAEAVSAVAFIAAALPDIPWIQYNLLDAKKAATALSWRLWDPSQVVSRIAQYHPLEQPRGTKERLAAADSERELKLELAINILGDNAIAVSQAISVETSLVNARGILAVATEWRSAHGGLSTLNRELCVALAALGHEVACLVVSCDAEERKEAKLAGVKLLSAPTDALPNLNELTRLLLFSPKHLGNFRPDFVIGHDHITGTAARKIAKEDYDVPYVHFVHTLPEEIEKYKNRPDRVHSVIYGSIKAKHQTDQCKGADIVIAVGPRIAKDVQQRLLLEEHIPVFELRPGMNEQLMSKQPKYYEDKPVHCLLMARFEDADLKGAPLACSIIKALNDNWGIKRAWTRPKLILRGFTSNAANQEAEQIDGYAEAMDHIVCRPFTQNVSEIATDIFSSAVVVMPSIVEGFGLTALEAIAAGVPTIVSSESGLAQVLMDKKISGAAFAIAEKWVVDVKPSDAKAKEEWAAKVKAILDDPECAHQEAKQLRDALRPHLNWDRAARLLSARLEELTSSTSGKTHAPA
jgi:glycosyltransferase involved in cell wall biosynthesis